MSEDVRALALTRWFESVLPDVCHAMGWTLSAPQCLEASGSDASFRRYFRWQSGQYSLFVMDAPPPQEDCRPFVRMAQLLGEAGLNVPRVLASDLDNGFLVLSDLGSHTYLQWLEAGHTQDAHALFEDALQALVRLQTISVPAELPVYDRALLLRELQLFPQWYVQQHLQHQWDELQQQRWELCCELLIGQALAQSRVLVHRDFMPRNLMRAPQNPGILDFQDAVLGPVSYDLVSLFKDAFISWPAATVRAGVARYYELAQLAGIALPATLAEFERDADLMGVQRHLKVIGIFARICYRDGKPKYLSDVPRFFRYIREVLERHPELQPLSELLDGLPNNTQGD
jgi:aminoglycoside/choline kinase family phosphotransferase